MHPGLEKKVAEVEAYERLSKGISKDIQVFIDSELEGKRLGQATWTLENDKLIWGNAERILTYFGGLDSKSKGPFYGLVRDKVTNGPIHIRGMFLYIGASLGIEDIIRLYFTSANTDTEHYNPLLTFFCKTYNVIINYITTDHFELIYNELSKVRTNLKKTVRTSASGTPVEKLECDNIDALIGDIMKRRENIVLAKMNRVNIEINSDQIKVEELINYFGFDEKYNKLLHKMDLRLRSAEDSDEVPASDMSSFREFMKNFCIDIARKICEIEGIGSIPENPGSKEEIGHARAYIKSKLGIPDHEDMVLDLLVKFTNVEGNHNSDLFTTRKYFRLTRNINIEICLFILSKLKDFEESNK